jgi:hypothetical protein
LAFEFSVLTLTVPGLRAQKIKNPARFRLYVPFSFSLTADEMDLPPFSNGFNEPN